MLIQGAAFQHGVFLYIYRLLKVAIAIPAVI